MKQSWGISIFIVFFSLQLVAGQSIIYVSANATGQNDGSTWDNAHKDLQNALLIAASGDQIWVSKGTYLPDTGANRNNPFFLKSGVSILGGFAGTETTASQRIIENNPTILNGNIGSPTDSLDNAYTILYLDHPNENTTIDGFIFENGYAYSDTSFLNFTRILCGGAVFIDATFGKAHPNFKNCTFRRCHAQSSGGAVFLNGKGSQGCSPMFTDCRFIENTAQRDGAAIYYLGGDTLDRGVDFQRCDFIGNYAKRQGASIYYLQNFGRNKIEFNNCKILNNRADVAGAFASVWGQYGMESYKMEVDSSVLKSNVGSLIVVNALEYTKSTDFIFSNNKLVGNTNLANQNFKNNITVEIYDTLGKAVLLKNDFQNENFTDKCIIIGGFSKINIKKNNFDTSVTLKLNPSYEPKINACQAEIDENKFRGGSNVLHFIVFDGYFAPVLVYFRNNLIYDGKIRTPIWNILGSNSNLFFRNNIFYDLKLDDVTSFTDYGKNYIHNNIFFKIKNISNVTKLPFYQTNQPIELGNNYLDKDCTTYSGLINCLGGNMYGVDPMFEAPDSGDFRLLSCSPLINAGTNNALFLPSTDFDGFARIQDNIVDIGPFESPQLIGDLKALGPACHGKNDGKIQFSLPSGCLPAQLTWSKNGQTGSDSLGLAAGVYAITVTDGRGKTISDTLEITEAPLIDANFAIVEASWAGGANGAASVEVIAGLAPFTKKWSTGDTTTIIAGLAPGAYQLTVTDAAGCERIFEIQIGFGTATDELSEAKIHLAPNPTDGLVELFLEANQPFEEVLINIFDPLGRPVFSKKMELANAVRLPIDLRKAPAGVYFLTIRTGAASRFWKLIRN